MQLFEFTSLMFHSDNPGGDWLKYQQEDCIEAGKNQFGAPKRFGPITGYFSRKVLLPVDVLSRINGVRGEQSNTRHDDLNWLVDYMSKNNHLPLDGDRQYFPLIVVDLTGTPWVNEGNHRIKAAKQLDWAYLPVEIRYFAGAEEVSGILTPAQVKAYDTRASSIGFSPDNTFKGNI